MVYEYGTLKKELFTEEGLNILLRVRDNAMHLLKTAGAFTAGKAFENVSGNTWTMLAALDYLVERGEIRCVTHALETSGQNRVFVAG